MKPQRAISQRLPIKRSMAATPAPRMLLALEALPDARGGTVRPYSPQAEAALFAGGARLQEIAVFKGHDDFVVYAVFSPDGRRVLTASWDMTVRIWDAETHRQIGVLAGHDGALYTAAFSPDGRRVVTAARDKTVADLGRRDVPADCRVPGAHGGGGERCLQPGWPAHRDRLRRQDGADFGRARPASRSPCSPRITMQCTARRSARMAGAW